VRVPPIDPENFRWGRLLVALMLLGAAGAFFYFDMHRYFSLELLKANRQQLLAYREFHYGTAVAVFAALYLLQTTLSLPGGAVLTLAGGFLFGSLIATVIVIVPATIGATLAFLAARYLLRNWVEQRFGRRLRPLQDGFARNGFSYLLTLRLVPLFPFFLVNLVAGLSRMSLRTYILATMFGIIPGTFIFANAGERLGSINSLNEIISPPVFGALALLALLVLAPPLYRRFR
jgi:uncharacterized membrane protein YdjX (TVP38/TMEM64 family)